MIYWRATMQIINNNLYNNYSQGYSLQKDSLKQEQELKDFGVMLNAKETQVEEVENEEEFVYKDIVLKGISEEARQIRAAEFVAAFRETMKIQGISDPSKINPAILSQVRHGRLEDTNLGEIEDMIEENISILSDDYSLQTHSRRDSNGVMVNLSQAEYRELKNQTIDLLAEILQEIKA